MCRLLAAPRCLLYQPDAERRAPLGRIRLPPSALALALTVPGFEALVRLLGTLVTGIGPLSYAHPAVGGANCSALTSPAWTTPPSMVNRYTPLEFLILRALQAHGLESRSDSESGRHKEFRDTQAEQPWEESLRKCLLQK